jgi:hypothetical protein
MPGDVLLIPPHHHTMFQNLDAWYSLDSGQPIDLLTLQAKLNQLMTQFLTIHREHQAQE